MSDHCGNLGVYSRHGSVSTFIWSSVNQPLLNYSCITIFTFAASSHANWTTLEKKIQWEALRWAAPPHGRFLQDLIGKGARVSPNTPVAQVQRDKHFPHTDTKMSFFFKQRSSRGICVNPNISHCVGMLKSAVVGAELPDEHFTETQGNFNSHAWVELFGATEVWQRLILMSIQNTLKDMLYFLE